VKGIFDFLSSSFEFDFDNRSVQLARQSKIDDRQLTV